MRQNITFKINDDLGNSTAILMQNNESKVILVLAHGAGAGMNHPFMERLSEKLLGVGIATFRFNFSYMEKGSKRPDSPKKAHAAILSAYATCINYSSLPRFISGKSFGGRMASQLLADQDLDAKGLIFFGFPLHTPGKEGIKRADHLKTVNVPMLFLQGTRDTLAKVDLMKAVCDPLDLASLVFFEGADHSFKTLKRSGISEDEVLSDLVRTVKDWCFSQNDSSSKSNGS